MGVKLLENVYKMVYESRMMYGVERYWGGGGGRGGMETSKKTMGKCAKKSWEFRDLLQMEWLNWTRVETVGGVR
jgi:hypothetical protein